MKEQAILVPEAHFEPRADLETVQNRAWIVGAVGAALIAVGYFTTTGSPADFYRAYLIGWLFCLAPALGLFGITMITHVSGGEFGLMLRRVSEASGRTLPFFLLAAVPIFLGLGHIYPWADPEKVAGDALLQHKAIYLNAGGFIGRAVVYFVIWTILAYVLSGWSRRHDASGDPALREKMKKLSAAGMVVHVLISTLAAVDWIMSLDPHWFSSLFGLAFVVGQGLAGLACAVPAMLFLSRRKPLSDLVRTKLFHDYGKLMLAATMVWGYFMISQYLIIWSGNLPEEIGWYIDRSSHGWQAISVALVLGHFGLPFLLLLSADLKKKAGLLALVAGWILLMRWLDFFWQVSPTVSHESVTLHWLDPVVPIGLGGLWIALLIGQLKNHAVVPTRDPALHEVMAHG